MMTLLTSYKRYPNLKILFELCFNLCLRLLKKNYVNLLFKILYGNKISSSMKWKQKNARISLKVTEGFKKVQPQII